MVLFRSEQQRRVEAGEIGVTYRAWQSPRVRMGERYRVGAGSILVDACEPVAAASISNEDARAAGYVSREALIKAAAYRRPEGLAYPEVLYRVAFRYGAVPAREGPDTETLSDEDAAALTAKLNAMDARSSHGPWTWDTLREIGANPGLVSTFLAENLNRERFELKADIRKLKALGLTISLLSGYELSPRGQALLDRHDA
ncbi:MAG: hypothetical protein AB7P33_07000 [Dehalococcoidia bacterium]